MACLLFWLGFWFALASRLVWLLVWLLAWFLDSQSYWMTLAFGLAWFSV
jgi:hypothetical protein